MRSGSYSGPDPYFRCLTAADENLGRILAALDELHLADDTMVVFSSDNGFYLGEHRLGDWSTAEDRSERTSRA